MMAADAQSFSCASAAFFMEVFMGNIYPALFDIIFEVFSSEFVFYPGILLFYSSLLVLMARILKGDL